MQVMQLPLPLASCGCLQQAQQWFDSPAADGHSRLSKRAEQAQQGKHGGEAWRGVEGKGHERQLGFACSQRQ